MSDSRVTLIRSARLRFGPVPRSFDQKAIAAMRPVPGPWLAMLNPATPWATPWNAGLKRMLRGHAAAMERGIVVWGCVAVANGLLWESGSYFGRGVVVYPTRMHVHDAPDAVASSASTLAALLEGGRDMTAEERAWRKRLQRQSDLFTPLPPPGSGPDAGLLAAPVIVNPTHLPGSRLRSLCLPVVIDPEEHTPFILPQRFWPKPLRDRWIAAR